MEGRSSLTLIYKIKDDVFSSRTFSWTTKKGNYHKGLCSLEGNLPENLYFLG